MLVAVGLSLPWISFKVVTHAHILCRNQPHFIGPTTRRLTAPSRASRAEGALSGFAGRKLRTRHAMASSGLCRALSPCQPNAPHYTDRSHGRFLETRVTRRFAPNSTQNLNRT